MGEPRGEMRTFYPGIAAAKKLLVRVEQTEGQTIFVPSEWYHTVENLEDSFSINRNWINATNVHRCWDKIQAQATQSQEEATKHQLEDDVHWLWIILSKKAKHILNKPRKDLMDKFDLKAIFPILDGMLQLIADASERGNLFKNLESDIRDLFCQVQHCLDTEVSFFNSC